MNKYAQMADRLYDQEQQMKRLEEENAKLKAYNEKLLNGDIEKHNKIVELEKKISILLSCKNCPDNKGGLLCQKEYEDKCLAQKIQYIKELKEENAELREKVKWYSEQVCFKECAETWEKLTKAKEIIKELMSFSVQLCDCRHTVDFEKTREKAEQFLKECE